MSLLRTRFAPSPTGSLHVGGARTALYCLLYARANGGRFVLRIEDTDQARSTDEAAAGILKDLAWLGLSWDEGPNRPDPDGIGPFYQSQRLDTYGEVLARLLASGAAYEAWDTREELDAARKAAEAEKRNNRYVRRSWTDDEIAAFRAEGRTPVVRLAAPDHGLVVDDRILGPVEIAADELDDIVIIKADGFPTYHFAVVVDDHLMGVTQVLRGQEHLMNTPKHLGILEALGWESPAYGHMPLIFNLDGTKMSKRDKAKAARAAARARASELGHKGWAWLSGLTGIPEDELTLFAAKKNDGVATAEAIAHALDVPLPLIEVMDYRRGGYLPEALLNYLALLGWSPGDDREILNLDEMIEAFRLERVGRTAARFDPTKLEWMNGEYIRRADLPRLEAALEDWLGVVPTSRLHGQSPERRRALLEMYQKRITTLAQLEREAHFFLAAPTALDPKAVQKFLEKGYGYERLAELGALLADASDWSPEGLQALVEGWAAERELGLGKVAQPLRVAVSGGSVSPPIFDTLALLGRDDTLARIQACLAARSA